MKYDYDKPPWWAYDYEYWRGWWIRIQRWWIRLRRNAREEK